ncbi:MAG: hypothetical protein ACREPM_10890, partial [Gemmatimonadaceae bacterium]
ILMLGDSFVFGQGVEAEDALPSQVERALARQGDSVSVFNGGVVGYETVQELAWLRRFGVSLHPGLVVIGFFLGNDIQDNRTSALDRFVRGVVTTPAPRWHAPVTQWLYEHSHLYALARKLPEAWSDRRRNGPDGVVTGLERKYWPPDDSIYRQEVAVTASALAALDSESHAIGAKLLVALIPEAVQIETARQGDVRRMVPDSTHVDFDHPNHLVAHLLDSLGIPWLDLSPPFRAAVQSGSVLYYPIDRHLTRAAIRSRVVSWPSRLSGMVSCRSPRLRQPLLADNDGIPSE